jgi:hypothetical protein
MVHRYASSIHADMQPLKTCLALTVSMDSRSSSFGDREHGRFDFELYELRNNK